MTTSSDLNKLYGVVFKISVSLLFYLSLDYISNETSNLIFLLIAFTLFGLSFFEIVQYYFSKHKDFYIKYKIPILFLLFAFVILIVFIILYFHEGEANTLFWSTLIPIIGIYFTTLIIVVTKK